MSSNEGSAQTPQSRDEPTASATKANSANPPLRQRPYAVNRFAAWARLVAGVVLIILVIAAIFFAGFFTGRHYGDRFRGGEEFIVPGQCVQTLCQPAGPHAGTQCYQRYVPCP
jgi:hypothetical protein